MARIDTDTESESAIRGIGIQTINHLGYWFYPDRIREIREQKIRGLGSIPAPPRRGHLGGSGEVRAGSNRSAGTLARQSIVFLPEPGKNTAGKSARAPQRQQSAGDSSSGADMQPCRGGRVAAHVAAFHALDRRFARVGFVSRML
jgi:hypothetical protein